MNEYLAWWREGRLVTRKQARDVLVAAAALRAELRDVLHSEDNSTPLATECAALDTALSALLRAAAAATRDQARPADEEAQLRAQLLGTLTAGGGL